LHLVPIAGSDFHAPDRPGHWVGSMTTSESDLERLRHVRDASVAPAGGLSRGRIPARGEMRLGLVASDK
jgi:hypothetical protein